MKHADATGGGNGPDEIGALVQVLRDTEARLQELMGGGVDAILLPGGEAYLLQEAQARLRRSEEAQRVESETRQAILNAIPARLALVDARGVISFVNEAWQRSAAGNPLQGPADTVGEDYLAICRRAVDAGFADAPAALTGLLRVLGGKEKNFTLEYPCPVGEDMRWFRLLITPLRENSRAGGVVMHTDITARRLAESKLRESEERFRTIFDAAPAGIAVSTPPGHFLETNAAFGRMLGYTAEELRGMNFANVTHPDDLQVNLDLRQDILTGRRKGFVMEKRYLKKDGEVLWSRHSVSATHGERGEIATLIAVTEDITQQKQFAQELQKQKNELQILFDLIPARIWFKDTRNGLVRVNRQAAESIGRTVEEIEGKSLEECLPELAGTYYADDLEVIESGKPKLGIVETRRQPDGQEVSVQVDKVPLLDEKGKVTVIVIMVHDITDRRRMEGRFRMLVDSNVQGVMFWHRDGRILEANDAFLKIVRRTRAELEAGEIDWMKMTPPEYADLDRRALEELAARGVCTPFEKEYVLKDGARVPILLGSAVFRDNPNEGVCFLIDQTERKKMERQFLRLQRIESIGTLAGGIAHDLNNILAPILMSILLLKQNARDELSRNILDTIEVSAKRGSDIVGQVLSFARGVESQRIEVHLKHLFKEMEKVVQDTFPKDIRMTSTIPAGTWTVLGDPTQIHQILLNLCVNARDAMPRGGHLILAAENCEMDEQYAAMTLEKTKKGRYVRLSVTDSGTGMTRDVVDKIFEPFFTTKEVGKGTGLGLSTVMAIVKGHEGTINVYSEPGQGTTFHVYLPAVEREVPAGRPEPVGAEIPRGNGETILLVDDETSILSITARTLEEAGYRVLMAENGALGVGVYADNREKIAVVVTDMMMPVMDGTAMIPCLQRLNPAVKVIAVSGLAVTGIVRRDPPPGVKHFMAKPYTAEALLRLLRVVLDEAA
jgi:PAS domain S-box-containing protein